MLSYCCVRGEDFRPAYLEAVNLRGIFTDVPWLGLSATVTNKVLNDLMLKMQFTTDQVVLKILPPDRPNIFLEVIHTKSSCTERDLNWIIQDLLSLKTSFPKKL